MASIDEFAGDLLNQAKWFIEKASESSDKNEISAYLNAAVMIGFCSFEAQLNSICDEMSGVNTLSVHERAILLEKDVKLENGKFSISTQLKIYRMEDRIMFLYSKFSQIKLDKNDAWWSALKAAIKLRNDLTHPKQEQSLTVKVVKDLLSAVIEATDHLYRAIYKKPFPAANRGLNSTIGT